MRTLHRPMFRYGGPIKEGVMSGIREPHARGSIAGGNQIGTPMGNRTGFANPKDKLVMGALTKVLPKVGLQKGFLNPYIQGAKNWWTKIKPTAVPKTRTGTYQGPVVAQGTTKPNMWGILSPKKTVTSGYQSSYGIPFAERAGRWVRKNPWWTAAGVAGPGQTAAITAAQEGPGLIKRGVMQIGDLLVHDSIFDQDKYFADKKAKEELEKDLETTETNPWKDKYEALLAANETPKKSDEEIRKDRIQKYRDIMDIKGMNKEAAYDSLIAASQAINESGDFKGDLRSGKLINQIIQGASKAFDKPKKTKDAIDTLILKGEIEKDIKSSIPTEAERAAAAFGISKEEYKNKLLGKNTPAEYIAQLATKATGGKANSVLVSQGYKSAGIIPKATIKDSIVDEWIEDRDGRTEIDYVKEVIAKEPDFVPGLYVVGDRAVITDGTKFQYDY